MGKSKKIISSRGATLCETAILCGLLAVISVCSLQSIGYGVEDSSEEIVTALNQSESSYGEIIGSLLQTGPNENIALTPSSLSLGSETLQNRPNSSMNPRGGGTEGFGATMESFGAPEQGQEGEVTKESDGDDSSEKENGAKGSGNSRNQ